MPKILIIDDDIPFLEMLEVHLLSKAYEVLTAKNGNAGILVCQQENPDLIICDIIMPDSDGLEFIFAQRRLYRNLPFKIIAISGGGRIGADEYLESASGFGVDACLKKPFSLSELDSLIENLLRDKCSAE